MMENTFVQNTNEVMCHERVDRNLD